jgi:hypothetical protein
LPSAHFSPTVTQMLAAHLRTLRASELVRMKEVLTTIDKHSPLVRISYLSLDIVGMPCIIQSGPVSVNPNLATYREFTVCKQGENFKQMAAS